MEITSPRTIAVLKSGMEVSGNKVYIFKKLLGAIQVSIIKGFWRKL